MELRDGLGGILNILGRFPRSLTRPISFPLHQILQLPSRHLQIQDLLHFVLQLSLYFYRWYWLLTTPGQPILAIRFQ
jgi:hypothetical protein